MRTLVQTEIPAFLIEPEDAFNQAMVSNDVDQIARYITDDWILVTPEAGPMRRALRGSPADEPRCMDVNQGELRGGS